MFPYLLEGQLLFLLHPNKYKLLKSALFKNGRRAYWFDWICEKMMRTREQAYLWLYICKAKSMHAYEQLGLHKWIRIIYHVVYNIDNKKLCSCMHSVLTWSTSRLHWNKPTDANQTDLCTAYASFSEWQRSLTSTGLSKLCCTSSNCNTKQ